MPKALGPTLGPSLGSSLGSSLGPPLRAPLGPPLGPLTQIQRRVEKLDRARALYRDALGLTELYHFPGIAFFALGETRLMLRETGSRDEADILYFRVTGIRDRHAALGHGQVTFISDPHMIHRHPDGTEEWMCFFHDDEGRTLALAEVIPPQ